MRNRLTSTDDLEDLELQAELFADVAARMGHRPQSDDFAPFSFLWGRWPCSWT